MPRSVTLTLPRLLLYKLTRGRSPGGKGTHTRTFLLARDSRGRQARRRCCRSLAHGGHGVHDQLLASGAAAGRVVRARGRGRGAAPHRRRHFRVAAAAAPRRGGLPPAGHRRPAAVVVPVGEPLGDAGEGGRRGGGGGAAGGWRPGLREGRLRRLLQEDLPLLREVEESLRRDVPVLAAAAAGAVRVGPGADPRDRALRVAGHGQAHLPAEGPGAPLRPRRPQGQRRRVAPPAQGHRPRVLHGQGQGHGGADGGRGAAAAAVVGGQGRRRAGRGRGGRRRRRHPELLLRRHLQGLLRRGLLQGAGDLPPPQGAVGPHVRDQRHLHHPVAPPPAHGEEPEDLEAHAGDPVPDPPARRRAPPGGGGGGGARLPGLHHREQPGPAARGRLRGGQLQEHLLRGARDERGHRDVVPHAPRRAPGVAGPRARRGARGLRLRRPELRRDRKDADGARGGAGDAAPVPAVLVRGAGGVPRHAAGPAARPQGHLPLRARLHHAPRRVHLGPHRAPLRPRPVPRRRGRGVQAPAGVHAVRARRAHLPRPEPRARRGQGAGGARPRAVCGHAVAGLQARPGVPVHHRAGVRAAPPRPRLGHDGRH